MLIQYPEVVYSLSGTDHVLSNILSSDINHQHSCVNDIASNVKHNTFKPTVNCSTPPYYFFDDKYSIMLVVDCGTNRVILSDI